MVYVCHMEWPFFSLLGGEEGLDNALVLILHVDMIVYQFGKGLLLEFWLSLLKGLPVLSLENGSCCSSETSRQTLEPSDSVSFFLEDAMILFSKVHFLSKNRKYV